MNLYVSQYLNLYPSHRNTVILFGGISGALDEVSLEFGRALKGSQRAQDSLPESFLSSLSGSDILFLKKRGHLTPLSPEAERAAFRSYVEKIHRSADRQRSGSLMIVPSYACNLACPYCFQDGLRRDGERVGSRHMTAGDADRIFMSVIPELFPDVRLLNRISICLYGGEPFLPRNEPAIAAIMRHTIRHQMPVSAVSNATDIHRFLRWMGPGPGYVNSVQISLDGDKGDHDRSRVGRGGEPTFDRIIENIHALLDRRVRINLRINAHRDNIAGLKDLARHLDEEELLRHPKVHVYAWAIHRHGERLDRKKYLLNWELARFVEREAGHVESPIGRRARRLRRLVNAERNTAPTRASFCMRSLPNSYLIDTYDDIYGCYEEAGNAERRIGSCSAEAGVTWEPAFAANRSRHVALCSPCDRCGVALTCGGGCPVAAEKEHGTQFRNDCDSHKACVARAIQRLFKERVENISGARDVDDFWDLYPNA